MVDSPISKHLPNLPGLLGSQAASLESLSILVKEKRLNLIEIGNMNFKLIKIHGIRVISPFKVEELNRKKVDGKVLIMSHKSKN